MGACRPPTLRPDELQVMLGSANRAECRLREPTGHCGHEHFAADAPDAEIFGRKVENFVILEKKTLKINENLSHLNHGYVGARAGPVGSQATFCSATIT